MHRAALRLSCSATLPKLGCGHLLCGGGGAAGKRYTYYATSDGHGQQQHQRGHGGLHWTRRSPSSRERPTSMPETIYLTHGIGIGRAWPLRNARPAACASDTALAADAPPPTARATALVRSRAHLGSCSTWRAVCREGGSCGLATEQGCRQAVCRSAIW